MKAIIVLEGLLLLLLVPLMWMCSGQAPVLVECDYFSFRAVAKRALFYPDEFVNIDELFLGTGCWASRTLPDELVFDYPISLCGIVLQVFYDRTIFHSWLTYKPRSGLLSAELRLECIVPSSYIMPYNSDWIPELFQHQPVQCWFLVRYRYCVRCRCAHIRDSWSTPFYGGRNISLQQPSYWTSHYDCWNFGHSRAT